MSHNEQQKILYVITKGNWGGAQKYVFDMATYVAQHGFTPVVACGAGEILPQKLAEQQIPVIKLNRLGRDVHVVNDSLVFFELIKLFRKEKPEVVHLNSSKIGGLGALAARFAGIKKIFFTVHGFAFNEHRPWIQKKIISFLSWLTILFSTDVIFISNTEYEQARHWPGIARKAHLVYNGIATPTFLSKTQAQEFLAETIKQPVSLFSGKTIIGTVAELTANKRLDLAIDAIKAIPNALFIIIGRGELHEELHKKIAAEHLKERVFLAGFVQNSVQYLKAFDLFVLSSQKEGMPYVLMEAGLAKLAVVSTNVGGVSEIIKPDMGILVPVGNAEALQTALTTYIHDQTRAQNDADRLESHIQANFTLGKTGENTVALYRRVTI